MHQVEEVYATVGTEQFVMLGGIAKMLIGTVALGILTLVEKKSEAEAKATVPCEEIAVDNINFKKYLKTIVPIIAIAALVDGVSYFLQLKGAADVPTTVLYPMITGASMIFSAIADIAVFRTKPSKFVLISVGLCFVGTLMFL